VLIGIASYRNPLARGFDMPHVVRYAIFYGVPKIVVSLRFEENLSHLLWALSSIRAEIVKKLPHLSQKIDSWLTALKKYQYLSEEFLQDKPQLRERIENLKREIEEFFNSEEVSRLLDDRRVFKHLQKKVRWFSDDIEFVELKQIDLESVLAEIDRDRLLIRKFVKRSAGT
jgi:reverse gyrase